MLYSQNIIWLFLRKSIVPRRLLFLFLYESGRKWEKTTKKRPKYPPLWVLNVVKFVKNTNFAVVSGMGVLSY